MGDANGVQVGNALGRVAKDLEQQLLQREEQGTQGSVYIEVGSASHFKVKQQYVKVHRLRATSSHQVQTALLSLMQEAQLQDVGKGGMTELLDEKQLPAGRGARAAALTSSSFRRGGGLYHPHRVMIDTNLDSRCVARCGEQSCQQVWRAGVC